MELRETSGVTHGYAKVESVRLHGAALHLCLSSAGVGACGKLKQALP